ncbi:ferredoxin [Amycolatopsis rhabdoformis]|uniref:Ferredoxin n=1 Tax=Amycolatopsis rhabdoformis TaxID=1448059 RepID=A0ABZ1IJQ4_9PSEU|nr:ferredoxin [Amycolatopsis rhabdoformis]WSE34709.1 ferredoxin [Amycolatopsis rhabdoformis]
MKLEIDPERCEGHGQCEAVAPRVLHLDDTVRPVLDVDGELSGELEEEARAAVSCCPVAALSAR